MCRKSRGFQTNWNLPAWNNDLGPRFNKRIADEGRTGRTVKTAKELWFRSQQWHPCNRVPFAHLYSSGWFGAALTARMAWGKTNGFTRAYGWIWFKSTSKVFTLAPNWANEIVFSTTQQGSTAPNQPPAEFTVSCISCQLPVPYHLVQGCLQARQGLATAATPMSCMHCKPFVGSKYRAWALVKLAVRTWQCCPHVLGSINPACHSCHH